MDSAFVPCAIRSRPLVAARLDIRELLKHEDVQTTMICTHVLNRGGHGVTSPLDA